MTVVHGNTKFNFRKENLLMSRYTLMRGNTNTGCSFCIALFG